MVFKNKMQITNWMLLFRLCVTANPYTHWRSIGAGGFLTDDPLILSNLFCSGCTSFGLVVQVQYCTVRFTLLGNDNHIHYIYMQFCTYRRSVNFRCGKIFVDHLQQRKLNRWNISSTKKWSKFILSSGHSNENKPRENLTDKIFYGRNIPELRYMFKVHFDHLPQFIHASICRT